MSNLETPRVGRPETIRLLRTAARLADGTMGAYGMGLFPARFRGRPAESHGGADGGYRSFFVHLPEERLGAAVLCNAPGPSPEALAHRILETLLGTGALDEASPAAASTTTRSADLGTIAGRYWSDELERVITIQPKEAGLEALGMGRPVSFAASGPGTFVTTSETPDTLAFGAGGLLWKRPGHRAASFKPVPTVAPAGPISQYAGTYRSAEIAATWTIEARDTTLMVRGERMDAFPVRRAFGHVFTSPFALVRFVRGRNGRVDRMLVTDQGGRLRRIPFEKEVKAPRG